MLKIEDKNQFIKINNALIRISKIDSVKTRYVVKSNNFGNVSDESFPEIIVSVGNEKHVFTFENEEEQVIALNQIEAIITL